jgi:hypothetical protein
MAARNVKVRVLTREEDVTNRALRFFFEGTAEDRVHNEYQTEHLSSLELRFVLLIERNSRWAISMQNLTNYNRQDDTQRKFVKDLVYLDVASNSKVPQNKHWAQEDTDQVSRSSIENCSCFITPTCFGENKYHIDSHWETGADHHSIRQIIR